MSRQDGLTQNAYNREKAVAYARKWAMSRNPMYYNFTGLGGDCANFASQCIYKGSGVMNYKPLYGWYYNSPSDRTPSWSGVKYLYNFLVGNQAVGPYASEVDISEVQPGDIIQLAIYLPEYHHTLVVLETGLRPSPESILIAAHSYDCVDRQLNSYNYQKIRFLHIEGVRK